MPLFHSAGSTPDFSVGRGSTCSGLRLEKVKVKVEGKGIVKVRAKAKEAARPSPGVRVRVCTVGLLAWTAITLAWTACLWADGKSETKSAPSLSPSPIQPRSDATSVALVQDGKPVATIVMAAEPTPAARFAALELRYHIKRITGVELPVVEAAGADEAPQLAGTRILVGRSSATLALGVRTNTFQPLEYLVTITPGMVLLAGCDWEDTPANRAEAGHSISGYSLQSARQPVNYAQVTHGYGPTSIELPGLFDEQGTCYAVYDFLERFCGVRWYGPTELNIVSPSTNTLTVPAASIRRRKDLALVDGFGGGWPIIREQWNHAGNDELAVFQRRMRAGGERWSANHTIHAGTMKPGGVFGDPSFKAVGSNNQLCYTHPGLIRAVAEVANAYFDGAYAGKELPEGIQAMGDHLALVPDDSAKWCQCARCAPILERSRLDTRGAGQFSHAADSYYIFQFINEVAKLVRVSHPKQYIAALAYWGYYYKPRDLELEPNISVAPCIQTCYTYVPATFTNELAGLEEWVADARKTGRPLFMWNYFHHPMEPAVIGNWQCFPSFIPHAVSAEVKRYVRSGIHGVYLCGIGQQLDYYIYMKTAFDASTDCDALLDEFFSGYFGPAGAPLKKFYLRVEEIHREQGVLGTSKERSWGTLGTPERMAELERYFREASALAGPPGAGAGATSVVQQRLATWTTGVWDYMKNGFDAYHQGGRAK